MKFVCTNCVKAEDGNLVIACFEAEEVAAGDVLKPFKFISADVDGAKLVAVDPYGVITILGDPTDTIELKSATIMIDDQTYICSNSDAEYKVEVGIILMNIS